MLANRLQEQTEGLLYGVVDSASGHHSPPVSLPLDLLYLPVHTEKSGLSALKANLHDVSRSSEICYLLLQAVAARLCASIALISTRKLVLDLHKVGTCPVLVKHCVILMHISVRGPGRNILCFFLPLFSVQSCVFLPPFSLLFCLT